MSFSLNLIYVVVGICCSALAQIFMKLATGCEERNVVWGVFLIGSILSYFFSFVTYYFALKYYPISKLGPVMTVGVVMLVVCYGLWSGEVMSAKNLIGLMFGSLAIYLILT